VMVGEKASLQNCGCTKWSTLWTFNMIIWKGFLPTEKSVYSKQQGWSKKSFHFTPA